MTETNPSDDQVFLDTVLNETRAESEDWCIIISPLPDKLGWRAAMMIGDGTICAGIAGDLVATRAAVTAMGRGLANIAEFTAEDKEGKELT